MVLRKIVLESASKVMQEDLMDFRGCGHVCVHLVSSVAGWSLNGSMTRSFEPEPDLDPVLPDLAGSGLNQVQIRF